MRITALQVEGFGVWTGLRVEGMAPTVNLLVGPNEAGKTTLMQFVRSILYGFSPPRRDFLPPRHGGHPGGWLEVAAPSGAFRISRSADLHADSPAPGKLVVEGLDGARHGEQLLPVLLSSVDEAVFNNVFAIGLRELQELGLLGGTEAASLLYNLSAGLDRVSVVEVMKELTRSRQRIVAPGDQPCRLGELFAQREKLQAEIAELGRTTRHYGRLTADRGQVEREAARLEGEVESLQSQLRTLEIAGGLRGQFAERADLDAQFAAVAPGFAMPEGALKRLEGMTKRLREHQDQARGLQGQRERLRREAAGLERNEALYRQAARIEALGEQQSWITMLQEQILQLEAEIDEVEPKLAAEQKRFGLEHKHTQSLTTLSGRTLAGLRQPASAIRMASRRLEEAKRQLAAAEETALALTEQFERSLSARGQDDLGAAIEQTSQLMAQLRRRVQIDERLEQMKEHRAELEDQSHTLIGRQVMPAWVIVGLGGVFVLGVILFMAGWILPTSLTGSSGLTLSLLGIAGIAAAVLTKLYLDRSNNRQLESCQKQIELLNFQVRQAKEEREAIDAELPRGGGPIQSRLEAAERELAALEELTPLDARRAAAQRDAESAAEHVAQCEKQLVTTRRRWREGLAVLGLPDKLSPKQVRKLIESSERIDEITRRLARRREELAQRRHELESLTGRIAQLAADALVEVGGRSPIDQLRVLSEELALHEMQMQQRRELRDQARKLRRQQARHEAAARRVKLRRRQLFREAGVADEAEFRHRAVQCARAEQLAERRRVVQREIDAALGGHCTEETVLEAVRSPDELDARRQDTAERLQDVQSQLRDRYEQRGRLAEQLRMLADDRRLPAKRLELAMIEKQIADAKRRWQVLALTSRLLESVRSTYERDRQPETLQEASGYLHRFTGGRYARIWTPIDEDVLRVDDADGRTYPVERLSHGTREQLFLSLRLALAGTYARRGVHLPMILDDVLVNFDSSRAAAAAEALREFAQAGHQLLLFTCHDHIAELFRSSDATVAELPNCSDIEPAAVVLGRSGERKRPQRRIAAEADPPVHTAPEPEPAARRVVGSRRAWRETVERERPREDEVERVSETEREFKGSVPFEIVEDREVTDEPADEELSDQEDDDLDEEGLEEYDPPEEEEFGEHEYDADDEEDEADFQWEEASDDEEEDGESEEEDADDFEDEDSDFGEEDEYDERDEYDEEEEDCEEEGDSGGAEAA